MDDDRIASFAVGSGYQVLELIGTLHKFSCDVNVLTCLLFLLLTGEGAYGIVWFVLTLLFLRALC